MILRVIGVVLGLLGCKGYLFIAFVQFEEGANEFDRIIRVSKDTVMIVDMVEFGCD